MKTKKELNSGRIAKVLFWILVFEKSKNAVFKSYFTVNENQTQNLVAFSKKMSVVWNWVHRSKILVPIQIIASFYFFLNLLA